MGVRVQINCEYCGRNDFSEYGSLRFCTKKCARGFSTSINRRGISEKTSLSLKGRRVGGALFHKNPAFRNSANWQETVAKISQTHKNIAKINWIRTREDRLARLYISGDKLVAGQRIKKSLIKDGIKSDICECCDIGPVWNGKPITLELDHRNGNRMDNTLENLRIICPNCHSQTDTYKAKNSKTIKPYRVGIRTVKI